MNLSTNFRELNPIINILNAIIHIKIILQLVTLQLHFNKLEIIWENYTTNNRRV
jgi:hypothetical protein